MAKKEKKSKKKTSKRQISQLNPKITISENLLKALVNPGSKVSQVAPPQPKHETPPLFPQEKIEFPRYFSKTEAMNSYLQNRQTDKPTASMQSPMQRIFRPVQQMPMLNQTIYDRNQPDIKQPQPQEEKKNENQELVLKDQFVDKKSFKEQQEKINELSDKINKSQLLLENPVEKSQVARIETDINPYMLMSRDMEKMQKQIQKQAKAGRAGMAQENIQEVVSQPEVSIPEDPKNANVIRNKSIYPENKANYEDLIRATGLKKISKATKNQSRADFNAMVNDYSSQLRQGINPAVLIEQMKQDSRIGGFENYTGAYARSRQNLISQSGKN